MSDHGRLSRLDVFGWTSDGKQYKADKLIESGLQQAQADPAEARKRFDKALDLLRQVPGQDAQRLRASALQQLGYLDRNAAQSAAAVRHLMEAHEQGAALNSGDFAFLSVYMAREGRRDDKALSVYLSALKQWANQRKPDELRSVYGHLQNLCAFDEGAPIDQMEWCVYLCERVIDADPAAPFAYFYRGQAAFVRRRYVEALKDLRMAERRQCQVPSLPYLMAFSEGHYWRRENKQEAAANSFVKAANLRPDAYVPNLEAGVSLVDLCEADSGQRQDDLYARRCARALELLQRACQQPERDAEALYYLGCAYYLNRDASHAADAFQRALDLKQSGKYYYRYARALARLNRSVEAIAAARSALELDPNLDAAHELIASISFRQQDYRTAATEYGILVQHRPDDINARIGQGSSYYHLGDYESVVRCLTIDKDLPAAGSFVLARSSARLRNFQRAVALLAQLVREEPENGEYLYYLGCYQAHLGRYDAAIQSFTASVQCQNAPSGVFLQRGQVYETQQQYSEARQDYLRAAERGNAPYAFYRAGLVCLLSGDRAGALDCLSRSDLPEARCGLGLLYAEAGETERADAAFDQARAELPQDASIARNYGMALLRRGEPNAALTHLTAALNNGDRTFEARFYLGLAMAQTGDYDGAIQHWEGLTAEEKVGVEVGALLNRAYIQAGLKARKARRYGDAIAAWEKAVAKGAGGPRLKQELAKAWMAEAIQSAQSGQPQSRWSRNAMLAADAAPTQLNFQLVAAMLDLAAGNDEACVRRLTPHEQTADPTLRADISYVMGLACLQTGDYPRANTLLTAAAELGSASALKLDIALPRAAALARLGNWEEAANLVCRLADSI